MSTTKSSSSRRKAGGTPPAEPAEHKTPQDDAPQADAPTDFVGYSVPEEPAEEPADYNIERDEETMLLRCDLTSEEQVEMGQKLTRRMYERDGKQKEFDAIKKQFNSELAAMDEAIKDNQRLVYDGYEFRAIPCQVERDYNTNLHTVTRLDTGEIVSQRPLRPSELQRRMFKIKAEQDAAEGGSVTPAPESAATAPAEPVPEEEPVGADQAEG